MSAIGLGAVLNERRAPAATVRRARIPIIFQRQSVREYADEGDLRDAHWSEECFALFPAAAK